MSNLTKIIDKCNEQALVMITCSRCKGTGMTSHHVVHMGVPGTCYKCDGKGVVANKWLSLKNEAEKVAKALKDTQEMFVKIQEDINTTKHEGFKVRKQARLDTEKAEARNYFKLMIKSLSEKAGV